MKLIDKIIARAKSNKQRIVLPESMEERTLKAANSLIKDDVAEIVLLGSDAEIQEKAKSLNLKNIAKATIVHPNNLEKNDEYIDLLVELRKHKGMTPEKAQQLIKDPLYLSCLMIKNGDADGEIAGAENTTGNVLRPALQIIKTTPGIRVVSGAFLMFTPQAEYGEEGVLLFADCAVMPNPNAEELAQIAITSGETWSALMKDEPRVAMLSYSTKGSAKSELIDKVVNATKMARELNPDLLIDGELQADAAIVPSVSQSKAPDSTLGGQANVLVFPTLEVGNIAYKLVQRLGKAEAIGPILQGMAAPVNDLSRGCSVKDIYTMVAVTANQAIESKKNKQK